MQSTASFFRALADRTRLRIVNLLAGGPLCVCDIQRLLGQPQSSVSRHLSHLRSSGLVRDRRDGMRTFYALTHCDGGLRRRVLDALSRELKTEPSTNATSTCWCVGALVSIIGNLRGRLSRVPS
jgi:ArsR family transcriptional regulator